MPPSFVNNESFSLLLLREGPTENPEGDAGAEEMLMADVADIADGDVGADLGDSLCASIAAFANLFILFDILEEAAPSTLGV